MKWLRATKINLFVSVMLIAGSLNASAANLVYAGNRDGQQGQNPNSGDQPASQTGSNMATPVVYNTNYSPQFSPYASYMQSPYSHGQLQQQYAPVGTPSLNPATATMRDPYMASEVSPYSHYSPYVEVVGEGSDYTLGIDDVLTIIVRDQPDFSGRFVVDPEGNVQYPFVGDIKAEGKTKEELKAEIVEKLKDYVRYPEVAVMISEYRSKAVYVFGYVGNPGKYAMKGNKITVKEAVVAAGLPRPDAKLSKVYVIRPSQYTKDGQPEKRQVDLHKLLQKGISAEDFILQPGDTIVVNQRYFDKFVNNLSRIVGPLFQSVALYELGWGPRNGGIFNGSNN